MSVLDLPLELRVTPALARRFAKVGLTTVGDLLHLRPRRWYHWGRPTRMAALREGEEATLVASVLDARLIANRSRAGVRLEVTLSDGTDTMTATFFASNPHKLVPHQRTFTPGARVLVSGKVGSHRGRLQLTHPEFEESSGDSAADRERWERPIPIHPLGGGLTSWVVSRTIGGLLDDLRVGDVPEPVPPEVRVREGLLTHLESLELLHRPRTDDDHVRAVHSLAWQEAFVLQTGLVLAREGRSSERAHACPASDLDEAVRASLPFTLTDAQVGALADIGADMAGERPMQRLLQGDVGSGKTVVALLAACRAIAAGHQAVLLAPTEVLAEQHAASLTRMAAGFDALDVRLLTGATPAAARREILSLVSAGHPLLVVGTHALLQEGVSFPDAALVVVDEQHRFGVAQRDRLRAPGRSGRVPHQLVMTATPIPRTVAMTVFGDLDVTAMDGLPEGRVPVRTHLVDAGNPVWMARLWERAREEIDRGGRVYVVCPRIDEDDPVLDAEDDTTPGVGPSSTEGDTLLGGVGEDRVPAPGEQAPLGGARRAGSAAAQARGAGSERPPLASVSAVARTLSGLDALAGVEVATLTGRTSAREKAEVMEGFAEGRTPLLVATTVVEVGVDVPEATMVVILDAQQFGLSQLHQLRGRVGRSDTPSLCMAVHRTGASPQSMARLEAFASTTDGFELAEEDLRLRREGDVLGAVQSGRASTLRFLDLRRDAALVAAAREAARELVADDPELAAHPDLGGMVRARAGSDLVWLERS